MLNFNYSITCSFSMADTTPVHFTRKNVYSLKNNILSGICLGAWLKVRCDEKESLEGRKAENGHGFSFLRLSHAACP